MLIKNSAPRRSLVVICLILFVTFLDNTIVSVVLSSVQSSLAVGVTDLQWIVDAYMLTFAVFMLSGGTLGDILGRKKVMLSGLGLFVIGSLIAAVAGSVDILIAGRVIMGLGAAASEPGTLSMIRQIYTDRQSRSRAFGVWAAVSGVALACGPIIGGVIIGFSSWRGVFIFSMILGLVALISGKFILPESSNSNTQKLDLLGLASGGISISLVTIGLILGENSGYSNPWIILLFCLSSLFMTLFIILEKHQSNPVLPLQYFRKLPFMLANLVAFCINFSIFAVFFFVALYLQLIAGFSGYQIAVAFVSMSAAIVLSATVSSRWNADHQTWPLFIIGSLIAALGIFILSLIIKPSVNSSELAWVLAISGIGFGICLVSMSFAALSSVPATRSGMASSTVNTFRELGGVFGVAILGSVVNGQLTASLSTKLQALHLPNSFQAFVIYAITHGGHTPSNVRISIKELASHASLISKVTSDAYLAFGKGLVISLEIAVGLLVTCAIIIALGYRFKGLHSSST